MLMAWCALLLAQTSAEPTSTRAQAVAPELPTLLVMPLRAEPKLAEAARALDAKAFRKYNLHQTARLLPK